MQVPGQWGLVSVGLHPARVPSAAEAHVGGVSGQRVGDRGKSDHDHDYVSVSAHVDVDVDVVVDADADEFAAAPAHARSLAVRSALGERISG